MKEDKILCKQAKYTLEKEIRVPKRNYSDKLRIQLSSSDTTSVWKGLKEITKYKTPSLITVENQQLADDLYEFYCRFEKTHHTRSGQLFTTINTCSNPPLPHTTRCARSSRKQKRIKAPGPDCVTSVCLKSSADQLAPSLQRSSTDHWSCAKSLHASNTPPSSPSQRNPRLQD